MRIISGKLGGRVFESPKISRTHPMSEKARGGLFNVLGDISGLTILDAFAGSGALGFEAISRGAAHATSIEIDKIAHSNILKNIRMLRIEASKIKAIRANVSSWSDNNPGAVFDIIVIDPPYDKIDPELIEKLADHAKSGGLVVCSLPPNFEFVLAHKDYQLLSSKSYGDAQLAFYRRLALK